MAACEKYIVGNWKMYAGPQEKVRALAEAVSRYSLGLSPAIEVVVGPPSLFLGAVALALAGTNVKLAGQDCFAGPQREGAHTGDISAAMLKEAGAAYVIAGHSERRQGHGETGAQVRGKAQAALAAGLTPIICVGETLAGRESGKAEEVVGRQLRESLPETAGNGNFILAYEPVWAIGSGLTPTGDDIGRMHAYIKGIAPGAAVLYGGSVKAANAREIMAIAGVDGVLVGGASLKAEEFGIIIEAAK